MRIITLTSDKGDVEGLFPVDDAKEAQVVSTFESLNQSLPADDQVYVKSWDPTSDPTQALDWFASKGADITDEHRSTLEGAQAL